MELFYFFTEAEKLLNLFSVFIYFLNIEFYDKQFEQIINYFLILIELAVGAPHQEANRGAVFIYSGTNKGLSDNPQVNFLNTSKIHFRGKENEILFDSSWL